MKKIQLILMAIMFSIVLFGCKTNNSISVKSNSFSTDSTLGYVSDIAESYRDIDSIMGLWKNRPEVNWEEFGNAIKNTKTSSTPNQLITEQYDEAEIPMHFGQIWQDPFVIELFANHQLTMFRFRPEFVRRMDNDHLYQVLKTKQGGYQYIFYVDKNDKNLPYILCSAYVKIPLQKSDFDSLKKGDSIEKVISIDPATKLYYTNLSHGSTSYSHEEMKNKTAHLLKNGVIVISYEKQDDLFLIADIQYASDYKINVVLEGSREIVYDFSIFPQDYIE